MLAKSAGTVRTAFLLLTIIAGANCSPRGSVPLIAAASDLQYALTDVAGDFERETGDRVQLTFGSSGVLARQIQEGAPFALFLSADEAYVERLVQAERTRDAGVLYAIGRIVFFAPHGSIVVPADGLQGLQPIVARGQLKRLAIANPQHAPYGRAAEQALRRAGIWENVGPLLVLGENVSQAAQFAASGNADGGIIAYSLVLAPVMHGRGTWHLIPETDHEPLRQRMVLLRGAGDVAERFYEYLQGHEARATLSRYGFMLPD